MELSGQSEDNHNSVVFFGVMHDATTSTTVWGTDPKYSANMSISETSWPNNKYIVNSAGTEIANALFSETGVNVVYGYALNLTYSPTAVEYELGIDFDNDGACDYIARGTSTVSADRLRLVFGVTKAMSETSASLTNSYAYTLTDTPVIIPAPVPEVSIDTTVKKHSITKMAMGAGLVYLWDADALYADGEISHIIQDIGIGTLRWPGGTTTSLFHWDALTGTWNDSWNPNYDDSNDKPPEEVMDLDEYLELIDQTGAEIMLGINMSSGKEWNRETEGIDEARALVQACKDRGYDVKYIYFDNESYHIGNGYNRDEDGDGERWTPTSYAESFNLYAAAVKDVYPSAKLIANWANNVTDSAFETAMTTLFSIAGTNIDYVDIHFYWEWGTASWSVWKSEYPMLRTSSSYSYKDSVIYANNLFASLGYPQIKMAVMEWNIGPGPWQTDPEHTRFKTALMQTEMQMQFLQAGLDIGSIWALHSGSDDSKHVLKRSGDPNPTALWMWLFSKTIGKTVVQAVSPTPGIYIVAAKGGQGELVVYLLNKTDSGNTVEFNMSGYAINDDSEAWCFKDDGSGNGVLQKIGLWETNGKKRVWIEENSLNMVGFNYPDTDADGIDDAWEINHFDDTSTADATSDYDNDGYSDHNEYVAGTDPKDPESVLTCQHELYLPTPLQSKGLLIGWDTLSGTGSDFIAPGIEGSLPLAVVDTTAGSTDGAYGSTNAGASTALTAYSVKTEVLGSTDTVGFQIVNHTGRDLRLDTIHFDYSRWYADSPQDLALIYASGDLAVTNGTVIQTATGALDLAKTGNYQDFDWSLAGLSDRVLGNLEQANFKLVVSNAVSADTQGAFDNIAISGEGIPGEAVSSVQISWRACTGKQYQLMQSTNLVSNGWIPAADSQLGQPRDMSTSVDLETPGFYRLNVEP